MVQIMKFYVNILLSGVCPLEARSLQHICNSKLKDVLGCLVYKLNE